MPRSPRSFHLAPAVLFAAAVLAGCGGSSKEPTSTATTAATEGTATTATTSATSTTSSSSEGAATTTTGPTKATAAPPTSCSTPTADFDFVAGQITVKVTGSETFSGTLALSTSRTSNFQSDDNEVDLNFADAAGHRMNVDIEDNRDPCKGGGFVNFQVGDTLYADGGHTQCDITVSALSSTGVAGHVSCKDVSSGDPFSSDSTTQKPKKIDLTADFQAGAAA